MNTRKEKSIVRQVRRNAVALISLLIALSTLSYSTWRNEKSEDNRNHRQAAFEILIKLNELQQVVFHNRYDGDAQDRGNPRLGWTLVLTIDDLAQLLREPMPARADHLKDVWGKNWEAMGDNQSNTNAVLLAVDEMRLETLTLLRSLE